MVFATEKIKQTKKFSLEELSAKKAIKSRPGLKMWHKFAIAIITGGILALASPGFDQWWLAWGMVAPFLVLLTFCHGNLETIICGFLFPLSYHLISLHYYLFLASEGHNSVNWQTTVLIWLLQAISLSVPTTFFAWLIRFLPLRPGYIPYFKRPFFSYLLGVPLLWVFLHWGLSIVIPLQKIWQSIFLSPIAIDHLAYSQYNQLAILQLLKYIGPPGLEFLLLLVNAAIAAAFVELIKIEEGPVERVDLISPKLGVLIDLVIALLIVFANYFWGQFQIDKYILQSHDLTEDNKLNNEITQPILPVGLVAGDWFFPNNNKISENVQSNIVGQQLPIIVFSAKNITRSFDQTNNWLFEIKKIIRQNKNSLLLSFIAYENKTPVRHNLVFTPSNSLNIKQQIVYPAGIFTILFGQNNGQIQYLPESLKEWLFKLDADDSSSWYSLSIPKLNWGKIGLLSSSDICDFRLVTSEVRRGASLLISSTNLSWSNSKYLNKQLLAAAIFRAIENNRYVLLLADGGTLAIIEPNGTVQSLSYVEQTPQLQNNKMHLLLGTVQFFWSKTPFTKMWWL